MAALSTFAAIAAIGAAGNAVAGAFKKPPKPPPIPSLLAPPDPVNDPGQIAERNKVGGRRARAGGLSVAPSTLLTGPGGLAQPAMTQKTSLLGQ